MIRHGQAHWANIESVVSCDYTCSHGISPGVALLTCLPQRDPPITFGSLTITDKVGTVIIPDCKLVDMRVIKDESGTMWRLSIADRRWRWRDLGTLNGVYNQKDPRGKLIPFMVRTPEVLIKLALAAMGEPRYTLNVSNLEFPPVDWVDVNPAQALDSLAQQLGCRVVYNLQNNSVMVVPQGVGKPLPDGSVFMEGPGLNLPPRPDSITLIGSPIRFQMRAALTPIGEDWDGSYRPLPLLSYAPPVVRKKQKNTVEIIEKATGNIYTLFINGTAFSYTVQSGDSYADVANALANLVRNHPEGEFLKLTVSSGVIVIEADFDSVHFTVETKVERNGAFNMPEFRSTRNNRSVGKDENWADNAPPTFGDVRATDRLTKLQAVELAKRSVWKHYALLNLKPDKSGPLEIPGFGKVLFKQQLLMTENKADQVIPTPQAITLHNADGQRHIVDYYDGYSRDLPARCYGSHCLGHTGMVSGRNMAVNSSPTAIVAADFSIDHFYQVVKFSNYIYRLGPNYRIEPADICIECAFQIRHPRTNQIIRYSRTYFFPQPHFGTPTAIIRRPDCKHDVAVRYSPKNKITGVEQDRKVADNRADFYLKAAARKYEITGALERQYNGIVPIACDGAIQQVTWHVGEQGATTTASFNMEHNPYIPTLPERRRAEFLAPVAVENRLAGPQAPQADVYAPSMMEPRNQ